MGLMNFNCFVSFCKGLQGQTLQTVGGKARFVLSSAKDDEFVYTPTSTGKPRPHKRRYIKRVFDRYLKTRSLRPSDYVDISKNASYALSLIQRYATESGCKQTNWA